MRGTEGRGRGGRRGSPAILAGLAAVLGLLLLMGLLPDLFRPDTGPAPAPDDSAGQVRGPGGGPPPPGTRVTAVGDGEPRAASVEPDGRFRFDPRPDGAMRYVAEWGPLRVEAPAGEGPAALRLPDLFTVSGRIVDGESGEPVAGAEVSCGGHTVRSDERGLFRLDGVPVTGDRPPALHVAAGGRPPAIVAPSAGDPWDDLFIRLSR